MYAAIAYNTYYMVKDARESSRFRSRSSEDREKAFFIYGIYQKSSTSTTSNPNFMRIMKCTEQSLTTRTTW